MSATNDYVIVTLGSMTEASSLGSMDSAPVLNGKPDGGAWTLWEKIAAGRPEFGRPCRFTDRVDQSKWISFTATLRDPTFFRLVRDFTGNVPGEGGLITLADSAGWPPSCCLINRTLSDSPKMSKSSGATACMSTARATS